MNTKIFYTPTKLFIGEEESNIGKIIKDYGFSKILFIYGKESIKKSGLYTKIVNSLNDNAITFYEAGGVEANPKVKFVRDILAKPYQYEMILAVGGGSVIDTAKLISVSYKNNCDPWDYNSGVRKPTRALPIGVILTISAAGSEMSNSCVITNQELKIKKGFNSDLVRPLFAIMNPKLTYSVSKYQTACGIVDIMMHTLERYISLDQSMIADEFAIGLLKTVKYYGTIAYNDPSNYEARKQLMLASSFSHNGLTALGKDYFFRAHQFEHILSGLYDQISHGAGLAVVWIAYSKYIYKNKKVINQFCRLAHELFNITPTDNKEHDAYLGIIALKDYFNSLGMPNCLEDFGLNRKELDNLTNELTQNGRIINDIIPIGYNEAKEIFSLMFKENSR